MRSLQVLLNYRQNAERFERLLADADSDHAEIKKPE